MELKEVKEIIEKNREKLNILIPVMDCYPIVYSMLEHLEAACDSSSDSVEMNPLDEGFKRDINCLLDRIVDEVVTCTFSDNEKEFLNAILLIYINFSELRPEAISRKFMIHVFRILMETERTLEQMLLLNTYLYTRIRNWSEDESTTSSLSRKYYEEYKKFLEDKDHDSTYSTNDAVCKCGEKDN